MSLTRKAIYEFDMIQNGDKVAVGVSGGKDSLVLLEALNNFKLYSDIKFELVAINVDMNFKDKDLNQINNLKEYMKAKNIEFHIQETDLAEILFDVRKEKNPCSLCSKMRRGALISKAKELNCNKMALGHHADDVLETFMLSFMYESRLSTFKPVSYMDRTDITCIRPFVLIEENLITNNVGTLPIIKNPCPMDKNTKREDMKDLIKELENKFPNSKRHMFGAITNPERQSLWKKGS